MGAINGVTGDVGRAMTLTSGATLTVHSDGRYRYNPGTAFDSLDAGAIANDSFTYTVTDPNGGVDTATVTLTITGTNDAPQFVAASPLNCILEDEVNDSGTLISQLLSSSFNDMDAGALKGIAITDLPTANGV